MPAARFLVNVLVVAFAATSLSGCFLDRSGLAPPATLIVEPRLFCPGDPVEVGWDASGVPRNPVFCAALGREFRDPVSCTSSAGCPSGAACLDGFCCPRSLFDGNSAACPTAAGCVAPFDLTITGDPVAVEPPIAETTQIRGRQAQAPEESTVYTLDISYTGSEHPYRTSTLAQMVTVDPPTGATSRFRFTCDGGTPTYTVVDMDAPRFASDHVRIAALRNISRHTIVIGGGDPARETVTLRPGESTEAVAGPARGRWTARLSPLDPAALRVPRCEPTDIRDPWPDLDVEWALVCAVEDE